MNPHFIIKTHHQSLKYLLEQRVTTLTQQAWVAKLMQFKYEIQFRKGKENLVADALSKILGMKVHSLTTPQSRFRNFAEDRTILEL